MLKTLILKGRAAKKFGKTHQFNVADLNEMIRAMCSQVTGFKKYLATAHHDGIHFAFFSGRTNVGLEGFDLTRSEDTYTLQPIPRGAKSGGLLQVVIGAAVLAGAFFAPAGLIALGVSASTAAATGAALMGIGISMSLGGVVQMLTPQPKMNVGASSGADNKPNYAFGAPVNTVAMGYPVPLLYGERETGGAIISAGIFSGDQQ
ncbi:MULTISPECIES: tail assembly protein [unclassified Tatumella]|uniref:tail assembly protein n=1 Tax=unclassified Tatumella TaxID=2649542 RepID=UPI001BAEBD4E|nr:MULTISPECIES: tail assembly protein [unclassified Tatumella]MBS0878596.1 tail assembly protein [Tatumella sp. JGM82]MBS0892093.1 tail assembly protein [Tatumella sp. JGM94]MBS0900872.1 tail assembly protein [Tatumella sp. JGM100]